MFRDGPLRVRPPEEIRYGTGTCALGRILVALSDNGGASAAGRRDGRQYRWVDYEAKLSAKRLMRSG